MQLCNVLWQSATDVVLGWIERDARPVTAAWPSDALVFDCGQVEVTGMREVAIGPDPLVASR